MKNLPAPALLLSALAAGCASTPPPEPDPELEEQVRLEHRRDRALEAKTKDIHRVLLNLDKVMDRYAGASAVRGAGSEDPTQESLERYLAERATEHFDDLVRIASSEADPANRARALGALGFSGRREALDPLLNGLRAEDDTVVTNAAFGLAMLKDDRTPPDRLGELVLDAERPAWVRVKVSGALLELQRVVHEPRRILPVWRTVLTAPAGTHDPWVVVHALRGVGRLREPELASLVEPYTGDPTPLVRYYAAAALGMLGNVDSYEALLPLLAPSETNPNVRLAARKALQRLAGGVDRGYETDEWRRVFQQGY